MFWAVSQHIANQNDDDVAQNVSYLKQAQKERTRIKRRLKRNVSNQTDLSYVSFLTTKLCFHNKVTGGMIVIMSQIYNSFSSHEHRYRGQIQYDNSLLLSIPYEPRSPSRTIIIL
jgi:hypothetical protein